MWEITLLLGHWTFCNAMASMNFWWWWWAGQVVVLISVVAVCRTKIDFLSSAACSG